MNPKKIVIVAVVLLLSYPDAARLVAQSRPAAPKPGSPPPRGAAPTGPLKLSEIIEALYSLGSPRKVEDLVAKRGVSFQAGPETLGLLKEFGATDKLLSLIPSPPPPPRIQPTYAGPLSVVCEPIDCLVVVNDRYYGSTHDGKKTVDSLPPGQASVQIFSDGYEKGSQQVSLQTDQPSEVRFVLEKKQEVRQGVGKEFLMDAMRALGGIETMSLFLEFQGDGTLDWADDTGQIQHWSLKFSKRPGADITMVFKTREGQCSASISGSITNQKCRGQLSAFKSTAGQAANLFLKYQIQNVLDELLSRTPTVLGDETARSAEISNSTDAYRLTFDANKLPAELLYTVAGKPDLALRVKYSNYEYLNNGRFPGQMDIRTTDKVPIMLFTLNHIGTRPIKKP